MWRDVSTADGVLAEVVPSSRPLSPGSGGNGSPRFQSLGAACADREFAGPIGIGL